MSLCLIFPCWFSYPDTHRRGSSRQKYCSPVLALRALSWSSEAISALCSLLLLLEQTQSQLYWWRHCHGFRGLRSGFCTAGSRIPCYDIYYYCCYETQVIWFIFLAEVCWSGKCLPFSPNFRGQRMPLLHDLVLFSLSFTTSLFSCKAQGWRYNQIISCVGSCSCRKANFFRRRRRRVLLVIEK